MQIVEVRGERTIDLLGRLRGKKMTCGKIWRELWGLWRSNLIWDALFYFGKCVALAYVSQQAHKKPRLCQFLQ